MGCCNNNGIHNIFVIWESLWEVNLYYLWPEEEGYGAAVVDIVKIPEIIKTVTEKSSGESRYRTQDLQIHEPAALPLSYIPIWQLDCDVHYWIGMVPRGAELPEWYPLRVYHQGANNPSPYTSLFYRLVQENMMN